VSVSGVENAGFSDNFSRMKNKFKGIMNDA
jgi:hypothetical protein